MDCVDFVWQWKQFLGQSAWCVETNSFVLGDMGSSASIVWRVSNIGHETMDCFDQSLFHGSL